MHLLKKILYALYLYRFLYCIIDIYCVCHADAHATQATLVSTVRVCTYRVAPPRVATAGYVLLMTHSRTLARVLKVSHPHSS
jgi:hypothetical protein